MPRGLLARTARVSRREDPNSKYHATLDGLVRTHKKIFSADSSFHCVERPIESLGAGLVEGVLRVRFESPHIERDLRRAVRALFKLYGRGVWDCTVTANVVVRSYAEGTYSVYKGQDFGYKDYSLAPPVQIGSPGETWLIPTQFDAGNFERVLFGNRGDTGVYVVDLINLVFIFRRALRDYGRQKALQDNRLQALF